jgi:hypothetical protein
MGKGKNTAAFDLPVSVGAALPGMPYSLLSFGLDVEFNSLTFRMGRLSLNYF